MASKPLHVKYIMCPTHTCAMAMHHLGINLRDTVWENTSNSNIDTAKLLHFSTIWKDFPGCSVICRLSVASSAAWICLGIWRCLLCGNAVVMSCKSALSMLIFLAKPLALFQDPVKSWWWCPQLQHEPLHFYCCFFSLSAGKDELEKVWPLLGESSSWLNMNSSCWPFPLSWMLGWIGDGTAPFLFLAVSLYICHPAEGKIWAVMFVSASLREAAEIVWLKHVLRCKDTVIFYIFVFPQKSVFQEFGDPLRQPLPASCGQASTQGSTSMAWQHCGETAGEGFTLWSIASAVLVPGESCQDNSWWDQSAASHSPLQQPGLCRIRWIRMAPTTRA